MRVLLCKPRYFTIPERDPDNKYMDPGNQPSVEAALSQHMALEALYKLLGLEVKEIAPHPSLPDMTFTANSALIIESTYRRTPTAILANFKPERRRGETELYRDFFFHKEGLNIVSVPDHLHFEGAGDALRYKAPGKEEVILLGYGFRTSKEVMRHIEQITGKEVVPLQLRHPGVCGKIPYHLDTACMVFEDQETFVLYPHALKKESLTRLEKWGNIKEARYDDFAGLALNGLVIPKREIRVSPSRIKEDGSDTQKGPARYMCERIARSPLSLQGVVITSDRASSALEKTIGDLSHVLVRLNLGEFIKSGGGAFCLTKVLLPTT